jgi:hypothetical protein
VTFYFDNGPFVDTVTQSELMDSLAFSYNIHSHCIIGHYDSTKRLIDTLNDFYCDSVHLQTDSVLKGNGLSNSFWVSRCFKSCDSGAAVYLRERFDNLIGHKFIAFFDSFSSPNDIGIRNIVCSGNTGYFIENNQILKEGAFGSPCVSAPIDSFFKSITFIEKSRSRLNDNSAVNIFPNPFNPSIHFMLTAETAELAIFDIYGKEIRKWSHPARAEIIWQPFLKSSSLFFVRIKHNNKIQMMKIIYAK